MMITREFSRESIRTVTVNARLTNALRCLGSSNPLTDSQGLFAGVSKENAAVPKRLGRERALPAVSAGTFDMPSQEGRHMEPATFGVILFGELILLVLFLAYFWEVDHH